MKRAPFACRLGRPGARRTGRAFTLLELLVVIAVVAILASLLLPTLASAKAKGHAIVCLNNHRQLILAWQLYADDHEDVLAYNLGEEEIRRLAAEKRFLNWVSNLMNWETDPDNTNSALLLEGGLGPYLSGAGSVHKCPSDFALSDLQRKAGWDSRVRSISMNATVGDAGAFSSGGTNVNVPGYRQFLKGSQIPDPSRIFVFIEEHPDSINDGYFLNKPGTYEWTDLPASYHEGGANLAFADGHVEAHKWRVGSTKAAPRPDAAALPMAVPPDQDEDFDWLMARTSLRNSYSRQ
jgi:prepilin-type N-terminal cleavage/methylation domain-containing protein/prepilin-type processing-associated H-X9-DG protein